MTTAMMHPLQRNGCCGMLIREKRPEVTTHFWSNTRCLHEEVKEMREVAQLRREIEHSMVADELMVATEWIERRNNNNDQEDESVGYSEDETVSD
mmetsp:Transcript_9251/g.16818  ORF Transcript_9251/g.16818 Transcript_9251/m.16818 type:complete len:95 (+) Transcript_9251:415-699(+)